MELAKYSELQVEFSKRNAQVAWVEKFFDLLEEGREIDQYLRYSVISSGNIPSKKDAIKDIDRKFWRECFKITQLSRYMDGKEHKLLEDSMKEQHVPFTESNVRETLMRVAGDSERMFQRGLYELFRTLSGNYRSHDAFKIKNKLILNSFWSPFISSVEYYSRDRLNDLDRCVSVINGCEFKPFSLESDICAFYKENPTGVFENDTYIVKKFKNGNGHIILKSDELVKKINLIIAKYAGENTLAKAF